MGRGGGRRHLEERYGGHNWEALWRGEATLNIGSLAIDPVNPEVIYCGTGEANLSSDSYPGVGIYRSIDGGKIWQLLAAAETAGIPMRIGSIAIDPFNPAHIRIGGVGHNRGDRDGLFVSRDGGLSWGRDNAFTSAPYRCHMVLSIRKGATRCLPRSPTGKPQWNLALYRRRRHLEAAQQRPAGGRQIGRMSLAFAPSKPSVMYALAEDIDDNVLGVFKTTNGGATWENTADDHFKHEEQLSYGNTIVVHPTDPDTAICGGVDLHRTQDGGATWHKITHWNQDIGHKKYAHSDHHCLLMPAAQPGLVYSFNDGGLE